MKRNLAICATLLALSLSSMANDLGTEAAEAVTALMTIRNTRAFDEFSSLVQKVERVEIISISDLVKTYIFHGVENLGPPRETVRLEITATPQAHVSGMSPFKYQGRIATDAENSSIEEETAQ